MGGRAVIDVLRDRAFTTSGLGAFTAGRFTFGTLDWTSGANAGRRVEVLSHDLAGGVAILTLLEAPIRPIAAGGRLHRPGRLRQADRDLGGEVRQCREFPGVPLHSGAGCHAALCHERRRACRGGAVTVPVPTADPSRVIAVARSWLGTPYQDQASLKGVGRDCLGLAPDVWREVF